jgi:hypothetical protein
MIEQIADLYRAVHQALPDATLAEIRRAITDLGMGVTVSDLVDDILAGRDSGIFAQEETD